MDFWFCLLQMLQMLQLTFHSGASLSIRSNEVLFPPQTKFRVKEDRQGLSMGFHFSINIASDLCDIYSTYVIELCFIVFL